MSNIADIADVKISIESPVANSAGYNNMLLIVAAPASPTEQNEEYFSVASVAELAEYGYTSSEPAYIAASIAFAQDPRPNVIYIGERQIVEESTAESIDVTLDRCNDGSWYGFQIVDSDVPGTGDLTAAATWADANEKLFAFTWVTGDCPIDISTYSRTIAMYGGSTASGTNNLYSTIALMAKCFGYEPGAETWAEKTLNGVTPSVLNTAAVEAIRDANANFYQTYANRALTLDGKVGDGEWIDVIRFRDWLINEIRVGIINLFATNQKITFTDPGITSVQGVLESILKRAQGVGGIAPDEFDDDGNVTPGYSVSVPRASEVSATDKASRRLTGVTFTAKLAGAIHYVTINGQLVY